MSLKDSHLCVHHKGKEDRCLYFHTPYSLFCFEHNKFGYDHTLLPEDNPLPLPSFISTRSRSTPRTRGSPNSRVVDSRNILHDQQKATYSRASNNSDDEKKGNDNRLPLKEFIKQVDEGKIKQLNEYRDDRRSKGSFAPGVIYPKSDPIYKLALLQDPFH